MHKRLAIIITLTALIAYLPMPGPFTAQALAEKPLAILLSCEGEVVVLHAGKPIKGSFGLQLQDGDEVATHPGASASIIWANGSTVQLGASSKIRIGTQKQTPATGVEIGGNAFQTVQNFIHLKDAEGTTSMARLRGSSEDGPAIQALYPALTVIRDGQPTFRWDGTGDSTRVQLTLYGDKGVLWEQDVTGMTSYPYPKDAPALEAGASYSWTLEAPDPGQDPPLKSATAFFQVISVEDAKELDGQLEKFTIEDVPNEATYYVLRASLFYEYGLAYDALMATREAASIDEANPTLHTIMEHLYAELGMTDEATVE